MAAVEYNPVSPSRVGATVTLQPLQSADDYYVLNTRGTVLVFVGGATAQTVTIETPNTIDGLPIADRSLSMAINEVKQITLDPDLYNRSIPPGTGRVKVTCTGTNVVNLYGFIY